MDRQEKTFHHNVTRTEFGGDVRGLAYFPWVAAEVPEGNFSGQRGPPEKCGV